MRLTLELLSWRGPQIRDKSACVCFNFVTSQDHVKIKACVIYGLQLFYEIIKYQKITKFIIGMDSLAL